MKKYINRFLLLSLAAMSLSACGDAEELGPKSNGTMLTILSQDAPCVTEDLAICSCGDNVWGVQMCENGQWTDCLCLDVTGTTSVSQDDVQAVFGGIFFSEYVEGSSNNKAIEVTNASAKDAECTINLYTNGSTSPKQSVTFSIEAGGVGAFCNSGAANTLKSRCFAVSSVANFNGDDALDLVCNGEVSDIFGHIGTKPKSGKWVQGSLSTMDMTLRRKSSVTMGRTETDADFTALATEWDGFAKDTFGDIGAHVFDPVVFDSGSSTDTGDTHEGNVQEQPDDPGEVPAVNPDDNSGGTDEPTVPEIVLPEPEPEPEPELPEWTFMVYINGDNNLYDFAASDFKEMQSLTNDKDINLIVLYDDYGRNNTNLYRIKPGGKVLLDSGNEIFSGKEADMGDYQTLKKFGIWAVSNYPAKHYAMVMWNHGGGWKDGSGASALFREFSNDENGNYNGIYISNGNYANALAAITKKAGQKLDIVGFDACLMAMYEVAVASSPYANLLVGSEETEPANGWSYDYFLPLLSKKPDMSAETLAKHITDGYYQASVDNATSSVTDLTTINELNTKLDEFADALKTANAKTTLKNIRGQLLEFEVPEHVDLRQFVQSVASSKSLPSTATLAAEALDAQLDETILYERAHNYYDSYYRQYFYYDNYTNGLAIYFPEKKSSSDWSSYQKGVWYSKTSWGSLVSSLW